MSRILGLIPARGGSKGLPRKNVLPFFGKPLIYWSIQAADKSVLINDYYVSTEDEEIRNIAEQYGCDVIPRPATLAQDNSTAFVVAEHALKYLDKKFDYIALLQPTNPLRRYNDFDKAIETLLKHPEYDAIIDYGEAREHPYLMRYISGSEMIPVLEWTPEKKYERRQQYPKVFNQYGSIYVCKTDVLLRERTFEPERKMPYLLEDWQRYDIDSLYDFICAEAIMKLKWKEVLGPSYSSTKNGSG